MVVDSLDHKIFVMIFDLSQWSSFHKQVLYLYIIVFNFLEVIELVGFLHCVNRGENVLLGLCNILYILEKQSELLKILLLITVLKRSQSTFN